VNEFLTWLLDTVQSVDPLVRTLLAGIAIMLETSVLIGLFVPGDTVVIIAATAVASPLEAVVLGIAVLIGALIGESIGFWLGRLLGPKIHHSALGRRIGEENWVRSERYLRRRGGPAIFISRFLPVLHSLVPLTVGMSGYPYRRFLAWTAPACAIWAALYITVASVAAGTYRELADQLHYAGFIFVGIIIVFIALIFVGKKVIEHAERRHLTEDDEDGTGVASQGGIQGDMSD
jgi:membrane protein DedA with SNARE-associated domain